jgi:hypothetical protein
MAVPGLDPGIIPASHVLLACAAKERRDSPQSVRTRGSPIGIRAGLKLGEEFVPVVM